LTFVKIIEYPNEINLEIWKSLKYSGIWKLLVNNISGEAIRFLFVSPKVEDQSNLFWKSCSGNAGRLKGVLKIPIALTWSK